MTQLSSWNIFHFPVFALRLQKLFKQSNISFSFINSVFVFLFQKYIFKQQISEHSLNHFTKRAAFFVQWLSDEVHSSSLIHQRWNFNIRVVDWTNEILSFLPLIRHIQNHYEYYSPWLSQINLSGYEIKHYFVAFTLDGIKTTLTIVCFTLFLLHRRSICYQPKVKI